MAKPKALPVCGKMEDAEEALPEPEPRLLP